MNINVNIFTVLTLARMPLCSGGHKMKILEEELFNYYLITMKHLANAILAVTGTMVT
jgi:hypothetical protein